MSLVAPRDVILCKDGSCYFSIRCSQVQGIIPLQDYIILPLMRAYMRGVIIHDQQMVIIISPSQKYFPDAQESTAPASAIVVMEVTGGLIGLEVSANKQIAATIQEQGQGEGASSYCLWKGQRIPLIDPSSL